MQSANIIDENNPIPKVLVVDDHQELLTVLEQILGLQGFKVCGAAGGEQALEALERETPDVIICDITMPGINGYDLQQKVRNDPRWNNIPFIFLTGLSDPSNVRKGIESGCDEYLVKPFVPDNLIAVVNGKLRLARERARINDAQLASYRRRIVHTLSHEFRTPLVSINTGTELLLEQFERLEPERIRRLLESIYRGGQRLQRLVEDFMLLQQIDSGHSEQVARTLARSTNIYELVQTAVECFSATFQEDGGAPTVHIIVAPEDEELAVRLYDVQIISVMQRLLSNCWKFAGANKPVDITILHENEQVQIVVRDFGPGLGESHLNEACQLFMQINRDKLEQQGCGLGLAIAQYFTKLNGGELSLRRPSEGPGLEVVLNFADK